MNDVERFEMIESLITELDDASEHSVILIEGKKDKLALEKLISDFRSIEVQREGGPLRAAERLAESGDSAIILTDWDNKGELLASELESQLKSLEVEYDSSIRKRLAEVCRKDIKDVESLDSLYERLCSVAIN